VHVITRKRLNEFAEKYPETKSALAHWYVAMKKGSFSNVTELRAVFPTADRVGKLTVFNIGGNRVRLIAAIHYNERECIFVLCLPIPNTMKGGGRSNRCKILT